MVHRDTETQRFFDYNDDDDFFWSGFALEIKLKIIFRIIPE